LPACRREYILVESRALLQTNGGKVTAESGALRIAGANALVSQDKKLLQDPESDGGHHEEAHRHRLPEAVFHEAFKSAVARGSNGN
jgi:hypothetical protein